MQGAAGGARRKCHSKVPEGCLEEGASELKGWGWGAGGGERPHRQRAVDMQRPGSRKHVPILLRFERVREEW